MKTIVWKPLMIKNTFYKHKSGLPIGSLLSGVLACIYLKFFEFGPFKYIIPSNSNYFRYIDNILLIYPQEFDLVKITDGLNKIEQTLKFTHELETNNSLPFLHILLIRNNNKLEFKIFCKTTYKNDHIHFYSHYNTKIIRKIIKGFYFRALHICSQI